MKYLCITVVFVLLNLFLPLKHNSKKRLFMLIIFNSGVKYEPGMFLCEIHLFTSLYI